MQPSTKCLCALFEHQNGQYRWPKHDRLLVHRLRVLAQQLRREKGHTFVLHLRVVAQRAELVNHLPDLGKRRCQAGSKHVFDDQLAAVAHLRTPDESTAVFGANATVIAAIWGRVPRTYIRCSEDQAIPLAAQDQFIAETDAMLRRLEESLSRMHQFSADLAHELRTLAHNLIGETEVALGRPRELPDYRVLLESNLAEFGRLTRMIDIMLFIARADNKDFHIDFLSFDVRKELESLKEFFDAMAEEKSVTVHCVGNALVWGDPALFRRAVSNLLSNAMNVSPPDNSISMQVDDAGHETWVLVSDEGPGIALTKRDKIFDRFFRIDEARTHTTGGAGLGLAIVHSILQLHAGTVVLHQTSSKGSSFKLASPVPAGNFAQVARLL